MNILSIRNVDMLSQEHVSINEYGQDYTSGNQNPLIKLEIWLSVTSLQLINPNATAIYGFQFWLATGNTEAIDSILFPADKVGINTSADIISNTTLGLFAQAKYTPILLSGDDDIKVCTLYVNPTNINANVHLIIYNAYAACNDDILIDIYPDYEPWVSFDGITTEQSEYLVSENSTVESPIYYTTE